MRGNLQRVYVLSLHLHFQNQLLDPNLLRAMLHIPKEPKSVVYVSQPTTCHSLSQISVQIWLEFICSTIFETLFGLFNTSHLTSLLTQLLTSACIEKFTVIEYVKHYSMRKGIGCYKDLYAVCLHASTQFIHTPQYT